MIQRSANIRLGEVKVESVAVPYIDLRAERRDTVEKKLAEFVAETASETGQDPHGLRTLVITTEPHPSDAVALALARQGICVIVGPISVPLWVLLDRFRERLRTIGTASSFDGACPERSAGRG